MSGICAVAGECGPEQPGRMLAAMLDRTAGGAASSAASKTIGNAGVGVVARFPGQDAYGNGAVLVACDAELYNEAALRADAGEVGPDNSKAALLAALYRKFGREFVSKLEGRFSFVIWDNAERTLLAGVDRFGINRLVFCESAGVVLVATRIDALLATGRVARNIDPRTIANVLNFSSNLGPETAFVNVRRIGPGAMLSASSRAVRIEQYWDMRYEEQRNDGEDLLSRQLEKLVERSVARRCQGDNGPELGAFLSGGTDSSTVVGMMTRVRKEPVKAFSIGFQEQPFNELSYAELAANRFGAEHHTYLVGPEDCFEALPRMIASFDEPFGNSSAIPTYFCARLAAQAGVKVLLAGDGGDELFGGNERYLTDKTFAMYQNIPAFLRKGLIEPAVSAFPDGVNGVLRKARSYVKRASGSPVERYFTYHFLRTHAPREVFSDDFVHALNGYSVLQTPERYYRQAAAREHLDRLLYIDVKITLADNDLPKVTCMSELAGIRTRFPFLDGDVAEFSGQCPANLKLKGREKRYLFKRAFRELLPAEIIQKKKHGFGIPVSIWLKTYKPLRELARDSLFSTAALGRGYFRRQFIENLFRQHEEDDTSYYGDMVWSFLTLELWHRAFVDRPAGTAT